MVVISEIPFRAAQLLGVRAQPRDGALVEGLGGVEHDRQVVQHGVVHGGGGVARQVFAVRQPQRLGLELVVVGSYRAGVWIAAKVR